MLENSRAKLEKKNVDMICANNLKVAGAGFGTDTNVITLITQDGITEAAMYERRPPGQIIDPRPWLLLRSHPYSVHRPIGMPGALLTKSEFGLYFLKVRFRT